MGRHKTKEEWKYWFKLYESNNFSWIEYFKTIKMDTTHNMGRGNARRAFRAKYKSYKTNGEHIIVSMTGKTKRNRKEKPKPLVLDDWTREELEEVVKRYHEITRDKTKSDKDKEAKALKLPKSKVAVLCGISRSGIYYVKMNKSKRDLEIEDLITSAFNKSKGVFGRDRIAAITGINYRRVGRYMNALGLVCKIRQTKRKREQKNTNVKIPDLVNRDYNAKDVIATDVSYIKTLTGFAYLSIAIDHYTKKILSWNFGRENTSELVNTHFKDMELDGKIVHSDHGIQYSSTTFTNMSKAKGFKISMSRVGNSLDNREAEYFFSNIKSEMIKLMPRLCTFQEMKDAIEGYIDWYNNERPQSILQWKTPEQFAQMSI